jgi:hypothetical protein
MSARTLGAFSTIRTEGALLPTDILVRVASGDQGLGGLEPASYHLSPGEKIGEATNRAWNRLQAAWANFQAARLKLPVTDSGTSATRERWLLPLFQLLDYGRLQTVKAEEIGGKSYSISHAWQQTPIHLVGCNVDLDYRIQTAAGGMRSSPHSLLQELLNRSDRHLWGIVSNGLILRLLRDNISLTRQAYVEFDLEAMMSGEAYPDFVLLWLLLHQSRFEAERPDLCQLEKWSRAARTEGVRILEGLRDGVQKAIEHLGQGFLAHPSNATLREKLRSGALDKQDYYRQLLRLVYRLLFLFVAEDRDLLLAPTADPAAQKRYREHYATTRLRRLATTRAGSRHHDLYCGLRLVMDKLSGDGCLDLALPALGSFLFSPRALPDLNSCEISNLHLLEAIRSLAVTQTGQSRRVVDYKNLGAEELGSVYESLLELHPDLNAEAASFELKVAAGSERKTTGSYYTPTVLIDCILDAALEPVVERARQEPDREAAILKLRVVDPACGSGHFLIAAAHRLAKRLAAVRTGEDEPTPDATRTALRDVIGRCIYGVDVNPMAVELCKVGLWMEALEPGKPLSFLEHRIRPGNSLIGATPALLAAGIPDEAFEPADGDDKKVCKRYRELNRQERLGRQSLFDETLQPWDRLGNLAEGLMNLDNLSDETIGGVREKERLFEETVRSAGYLYGKFWADSWCAALAWRKTNHLPYPITEEVFRRIERNPYSVDSWLREEVERLASPDAFHFFHWHLAFPEVFHVDRDSAGPAGWSGGFDVVIGNPPWVRQEFLKSAKRLFVGFETYSSTVDSSVLFLERAVQIAAPGRRVGLLTPNKWFRAAYAERLRSFLRENARVRLLVDFGHSHDLFPKQDTFPAAVVLEPVPQRVADDVTFQFVCAHDSDREKNALTTLIGQYAIRIPHVELRPERWQLENADDSRLLDRLMNTGVRLSVYAGHRPIRGILTGLNEAYYVDTETRNRLVGDDSACEPLLKRFLRGRDIKRWKAVWGDQWHIVIPSSQNRAWPWSNAGDEAEAEAIFAQTYPSLHDHLKRFEEKLRKRADKGRFWWELRACDYYDRFDSPKILVQCIAYFSQFALDLDGQYANNKILFIPLGDLYLLAILNSRISWWLINRTFQHMKDDGLSVDVQFLLALPVPEVEATLRVEIEQTVRSLLTDPSVNGVQHEFRLNRLVEQAFQLTTREREVIENSLPPRDPIAILTGVSQGAVPEVVSVE